MAYLVTEIINLASPPPSYSIYSILDIDWIKQFLPPQVPEWIMAIEDENERNEMMSYMELDKAFDDFDSTQTPFYQKIVIIRP